MVFFKNLPSKVRNISPSQQVLLALFVGLALGLIFREKVAFMKIFGDIFLKMIKMTVVPLIFISVAQVFCSMGDAKRMGRVAVKSVLIYKIATVITAAFGVFVAVMLEPGVGVAISPETIGITSSVPVKAVDMSASQMLLHIFPENIFESFVRGDILQILVFAMFFGVAANRIRTDVQNVVVYIDSMAKIVFNLISIVIKFTPIGVLGIIAYLSGTQDLNTLKSLLYLVLIVYCSGFILCYGFYSIVLLCFGLNPIPFFKKVFPVQYFAFLTSSSAAAVPLAKTVAEEKMGVTRGTASLTVPLGAAFNLSGSTLHLGITSVFLAQIYGLDLTMAHYIKIVFLSMMLTMGGAGIPALTLLMMPMILVSIGVPAEYVAVYIGVDRFLDMLRSALNATGDVLAAVITDKSEKTLDMITYTKSAAECETKAKNQTLLNQNESTENIYR